MAAERSSSRDLSVVWNAPRTMVPNEDEAFKADLKTMYSETMYSDSDSESDDESEEAQRAAIAAQGPVSACVSSNIFQYSVGMVIVGNTVAMAIQVDNGNWRFWPVVEDAFLVFFVAELSLRIFVYGADFFCDVREWRWNMFDFSIVLLGVVEYFVRVFDIKHAKVAKLVTILRTLRVLRILRLLRVIKVFRALYGISVALFTSLKSVFWISLMFSIVIVVSAIFTTTLIGKEAQAYSDPELVELHFGTVPASMTTLFQFVTLDDWSSVSRVIVATYPIMEIFFCGYIFLTSFTMLSVMTGMITGQTQRIMDEHDERSDKKFMIFLQRVGRIFNHWDTNGNGTISCDEFLDLFHEKKVHSLLYVHGIDIDDEFEDGEELFSCMDHESNGEITLSEFRDGLQRMRGIGKAKDFFRMQSMISRVEEKLDNLGVEHSPEADTSLVHRRLDKLMEHAGELLRRMERMEEEFGQFSRTMPPPDDDIPG
eukprot:gnl/MRDRNA2_/MRDRNA2_56898_c0_seq1.p1 gnl/MRDRNA2_/MRDRNA2_56898_c0~~gnl/MRDRNA2_/MRDRNA2_56898_c0_seq1.p1  ORF type:complete len:483 (+),score=90.16 gnl/MRDRNA2_/MRDRNA2_56898_c0_seq1:150-1598(+)